MGKDVNPNFMPDVEDFWAILCDMRNMLRDVIDCLKQTSEEQNKLIDEIFLDTQQVTDILGIHEKTLYRWRTRNLIPYHHTKNNTIMYNFDALYKAIKSGKIDTRKFDREAALMSMEDYFTKTYRNNGLCK